MNQIKEILLLHHCHTDIGFTHPQPVLWELQRRFIDEAIDLCEATADWPEPSRVRWTCETTSPLLYWLDRAPASQVERFRKLVAAGQMGAGALAFHSTPMFSAAQFARTLEPLRRLREELGLPLRVAISHDVNGHPWPTTQLLSDAGVGMLLVGINVHFGGYPLHRPMAFRWQGADDRDLLVFNGEHYNSFNQQLGLVENSLDVLEERLDVYWRQRVRRDGRAYPHDFLFLTSTHTFYPDNNPPSPATAGLVRRWNDEGRQPRIRYVTPETLLERLNPATVPVHKGDWPDYWAFGLGSAARETRIHRESGARLNAAETLLAHTGVPDGDPENLDRARDQIALFNEHTWSAFSSVEYPDRDGVAEQWMHKAAAAWTARSLISLAMRGALEKAAGNPVFASGLGGILLYNPGPEPVQACPRLPAEWRDGTWEHFCSTVHGLDDQREALGELAAAAKVGPIEVPGCGYRIVARGELADLAENGWCVTGVDFLQSPFFRLEFDPVSGRIRSLRNLQSGAELVDANNPWPFFGFVTETVDAGVYDHATPHGGRDAFYTFDWEKIHADTAHWRTDWPANRTVAQRLRALRTECDGEGATLVLSWEDDVSFRDLEQRITLPAFRPVVELFVSYQKTDIRTAEGNYLVFPLALEEWEAWYDTANLPVKLDAEIIPGACRDYQTAGSYAAMADARQAVVLACPDAPMVQFGDFHFGRKLARVPRHPRPLLLAWLTNNYWNTNFRASQPGPLRFRYELRSAAAFDPVEAARAGASARSRVEVHPVTGACESLTQTCLSLEGPGLVLLEACPDRDDPRAVLVRVANVSASSVQGRIGLAGALVSAALCSALGEPREPLLIEKGRALLALPAGRLATLILRR